MKRSALLLPVCLLAAGCYIDLNVYEQPDGTFSMRPPIYSPPAPAAAAASRAKHGDESNSAKSDETPQPTSNGARSQIALIELAQFADLYTDWVAAGSRVAMANRLSELNGKVQSTFCPNQTDQFRQFLAQYAQNKGLVRDAVVYIGMRYHQAAGLLDLVEPLPQDLAEAEALRAKLVERVGEARVQTLEALVASDPTRFTD